MDFYADHFSFLFLSFFCNQVRTRSYDLAQRSRADGLKAVVRRCSLFIEVSDALVVWTDHYQYQFKKKVEIQNKLSISCGRLFPADTKRHVVEKANGVTHFEMKHQACCTVIQKSFFWIWKIFLYVKINLILFWYWLSSRSPLFGYALLYFGSWTTARRHLWLLVGVSLQAATSKLSLFPQLPLRGKRKCDP